MRRFAGSDRGRRRVGLTLIGSAAVTLAIASTAWACGVLATLKANPGAVAPGQAVTVTGNNYSSSAAASDVSIRLNGRNGPVLATAKPPTGSTSLNANFTLPSITPGWKVLVATQTVNGVPKTGTPGRTTMRVQGAAQAQRSRRQRSEVLGAPWSSSDPTGPSGSAASVAVDGGGSGGPTLPTLLGIVMSLGLLGTGLTLVARNRTSTANRPLLGA